MKLTKLVLHFSIFFLNLSCSLQFQTKKENKIYSYRGALQPSGRAHGTRPRRGRRRAGVPAAAVQEGEGKGAGEVEEGTRKLTAYSNRAEVGRRIELDVWG